MKYNLANEYNEPIVCLLYLTAANLTCILGWKGTAQPRKLARIYWHVRTVSKVYSHSPFRLVFHPYAGMYISNSRFHVGRARYRLEGGKPYQSFTNSLYGQPRILLSTVASTLLYIRSYTSTGSPQTSADPTVERVSRIRRQRLYSTGPFYWPLCTDRGI